MFDLPSDIAIATRRIRPYVRETPLEHSLYLSQLTANHVFLKLETVQHTGSFKVRGAMNKLLAMSADQRSAGVVAASSGNHGAAVAYGLHILAIPGVIFVPTHAAPTKVSAIQNFGIEVRSFGDDSLETEVFARDYARQHGLSYISPYNDWDVVAGQGSLAVELMEQRPDLDVIFAAVGGGGLIGGIASYLKTHARRPISIIGCLPEQSPVMAESVRAGHIIEVSVYPTLSDGTAGGIEPEAITFDLCQSLVDEYILVSEAEIEQAIRLMHETHHHVIEGAAGVALAAYLKSYTRWIGRNIAIVLCGANISQPVLQAILGEGSNLDHTTPIGYHSCFISYSSKDEALAKQLHADLQAAGVRCWYAPYDLRTGDSIIESIDQAIRSHEKLLLILSESSVASRWVGTEVKTAIMREHNEGRTVLIPIRIDDAVMHSAAGWAAQVQERHTGDFRQWKDDEAYQATFARLLRDLKAEQR